MKLKIKILLAILGLVNLAIAQNWETTGNTVSANEKLGTTNFSDLNFITNNIQNLTLKSNGFLGLGITTPRAKQEILYCPQMGSQENGFIVTKRNCLGASTMANPINFDIIGGGMKEPLPDGESPAPSPDAPFVVPFDFLTGHSTNATNPLYNINKAPILWLRTEDPQISQFYNGPTRFDTKMIVMPDGSTGINIANPRAALDVRGSQFPNRPAAIFGSRAIGTGGPNGPGGLFQYYTQQIQIVPILNENGYNRISKANDQGMFFSDGKGLAGANLNGALVLAPWSVNNDQSVGGMRMDNKGDVEFHGKVKAINMKIEVKWWSDFVFNESYSLMPMNELRNFLKTNKHLPGVPSEKSMLTNGLDIADMQAIQLQKIEELTLYLLAQQKEIEDLKAALNELKNQK